MLINGQSFRIKCISFTVKGLIFWANNLILMIKSKKANLSIILSFTSKLGLIFRIKNLIFRVKSQFFRVQILIFTLKIRLPNRIDSKIPTVDSRVEFWNFKWNIHWSFKWNFSEIYLKFQWNFPWNFIVSWVRLKFRFRNLGYFGRWKKLSLYI